MKDEMCNAGYKWDGKNWTSPFTGLTTSFQPAREEFLMMMRLKPEYREKDTETIARLEAERDTAKRRARRQSELLLDREAQLSVYRDALRRIRDSLVGWHDGEANGLLESIGSIANEALAYQGQVKVAKPEPPRFELRLREPAVGTDPWWDLMLAEEPPL